MKICRSLSCLVIVLSVIATASGQKRTETFEQIEMLFPDNKTISVRVILTNDIIRVVDKRKGTTLKIFKYTQLKTAEYSYSENYRWRESWALTAAGFVIPPLWLVSLPLGFTKSKQHWLTILGENDYVVLKVNETVRKMLIPSFEVHTGLRIKSVGNSR